MFVVIIFIIVVVAIAAWYISTRNNLISIEERLKNSKSQIAVQIESRWDALTNLIKATEKYSDYEKETLKEIVEERGKVTGSSTVDEMQKSDREYAKAFSNIMAIVERYPDLKSNTIYQSTMTSINKYEDNVRYARMTYNDMATKYNRTIKSIPTNIVANQQGMTPVEYFEGTETKQEMPQW